MNAEKYLHRILAILLLTILTTTASHGQRVALRNNLLYDATLSPNLGLELHLDSAWSLGANAGFNAWDIDKDKNKKWRHVLVSPYLRHYNTPARYRRSGNGAEQQGNIWIDTLARRSFWGIHAVYSHYNVGGVKFPLGIYSSVKGNRRQGDLVALGGSYGYNWRLTGRLHLEAELGMALGYTWYKEYDCPTCGAYHGRSNKLFVLPKMGLNLVWSIGRKPLPPVVLPPVVIPEPEPEPEPVMLAIHDVADNTGRAGELQQDNPVLEHISQYRPYDRTRILRKEKGALYVHFPVGKADLRHDFSNNAATLDRIVDITRQVMADTTSTVKKIQLIGLASIEGSVAGNEQLAANRALALQRYLQQQVNTPNALYETVGGGEAWADLRDILNEETAKSEKAAAAQAALDIIDSEPNADLRERKLRQLNGGRPWQYISKELLPQLRNSGYIRIYYDYVPDSAAAVINRASELLRTDCEDCHREALALLQQVSTDERAQNALGVAYYLCHRPDDALRCFRRAASNGNEDARRNVREMEKNLKLKN